MAAGGPWSVKGIAPQAREAAKDAARREGKTLGEWLNEIILETGDEAAAPRDAGGESAPAETRGPGPESLEALTRRLEASEHRSTLAITGIDQSVRGLIARLEAAESAASEVAGRAGENVSELHHAHAELARRLAALEEDDTAQSSLQAARTLEDAISRVAGHVHDRDKRSSERAGEIEERIADLDSRFAKASEDLTRRVDAASDHAAMQAMRATNDLRQTVETQQAKTSDSLASLEATIGRITQRLSAAEGLTDNAMRSLEASFAHLDDRLRKAEQTAREASAENIAEKLEQKFEALGRELRDRIDQVRTETAQTIEASSPRLDRLERALEKSTKRNSRTLSQIGDQIGMLGQAMDRRLEESERRLREDAIQDRTLETRLREVEHSSSEAIRKVAESVEQISLRLAERIEASESRNADTVATLGREMAKLAERMTPPQAREEDTLATRLRESERRTQQMIRDAVAGVSAKLDAVRDETESGLSPVQSALANLAGRLEAIENGDPDAAPPPVRPAPPRREREARSYRSSLPPAEDALSAFPSHAKPAAEPEAEAEPEEEIAIEPPARPNPFTDALDDPAADMDLDLEPETDDPWSERAGTSDTFAMPPPEPEPEPEARAEPAPAARTPAAEPAQTREEVSRPLGATADSSFLAQARKSARGAPGEGKPRARGSVLETRRNEDKSGGGRRVLVLAGLLAIVTLGGAAYLLFMDGMPFGEDGARLAGELNDREVVDVLNGGSTEELAVIDGAPPAPIPSFEESAAPAEAGIEEPASAPFAGAEDGVAAETEETPAEDTAVETPAEPAPEQAAATGTAPVETPAQAAPVETTSETAIAGAPETATAEAAPEAPAESAPPPPSRIISGVDEGALAAPAAGAVQPEPVQPAPAETPAAASFDSDPAAQFQIGEAQLQSGDAEAGAQMIRSSANQGYAPAQYRLGKLYETGAGGVPQDDVQARQWTERAAVAGNRNAMHNLGLMYAEGRGATQDDQQAAQWFERAAQIGATDSQFNLAVLYEQGRGVPQSLADAYAWYRIAQRAGDSEAGERADLIASQIPPEAKAEADSVASIFQPRAVDPVANGAAGPQAASAPDTVQRAQLLLAGLGYAPGPVTGEITPQTQIAIMQYQRDAGMAETGAVDEALIASLQQAAAR